MLPAGDFEARFFAALAALASLLVHVALLVLFFTGSVAPPASPPLVVEIVSAPREPRPPPSSPEPAEPLPPSPAPPAREPAVALPEERAPDAPLDFRERIRRREAAFQQDMAVRRERVATLERFLQEQKASASVVEDVVSLCGAHDPGPPVAIEAARSMARYADLTPVGLFPPRYLEEVTQVAREGKALDRLGRIEMALPPREVIVQLDEPAGAVFAIGRRDARCLVGFSWSRDIFPLRFRGLPARYIDADDAVRELTMDVVLHIDATFELTVQSGDELPFARGSLYDQDAVARNLEQRATGARMVRDFLGALLGG